MGRPEILTDDTKAYIFKLKQANPKITAREVIGAVKDYLIDEFSKSHNSSTRKEIEAIVIDEQLSESAIIKFITELNHELKNPSPLDKPWSVLSLVNYPIEPEVLPTVLRLYALTLEEPNPLTIRQVLWVSRLFYVFKEYHSSEDGRLTWEDSEGQIRHWEKDSLFEMTRQYALDERTLNILVKKSPDMEPKMWFQSLNDAMLSRFATKDDQVLKTAISELVKRNKLNQEKYLQWNQRFLQIQKEEDKNNERLNKATNS